MKQLFRNNKMSIVLFALLMFWVAVSFYQYLNDYNKNLIAYNKVMLLCEKGELVCHDFEKPFIPDTVTVFSDIMWNYSTAYIVLVAPIVIVLASLWKVNQELKSGFFKNVLLRKDYKTYVKKMIISAYKNIWILPAFVLAVFFFSYLISGNFDYERSMSIYSDYLLMDKKYLDILPIFMLTFLTVIALHSIMYINFGFLAMKKNANFLVTLILSYLLFFLFQIFIVIGISGLLLANLLDIHYTVNSLSLFSIWNYRGVYNLPFMLCYSLLLAGGSTILVFYEYRDKEEVIIENEI